MNFLIELWRVVLYFFTGLATIACALLRLVLFLLFFPSAEVLSKHTDGGGGKNCKGCGYRPDNLLVFGAFVWAFLCVFYLVFTLLLISQDYFSFPFLKPSAPPPTKVVWLIGLVLVTTNLLSGIVELGRSTLKKKAELKAELARNAKDDASVGRSTLKKTDELEAELARNAKDGAPACQDTFESLYLDLDSLIDKYGIVSGRKGARFAAKCARARHKKGISEEEYAILIRRLGRYSKT